MRVFSASLAVIPLAFMALTTPSGVAAAQSADQIINALSSNGSTRGIRLGGQPPAAAPRPVRAAVAVSPPSQPRVGHTTQAVARAPLAVPEPVSGPSIPIPVVFPSGSADLTAETRASVDELGKALTSPTLATGRFRIEGHTDSTGNREDNLYLSQRRAQAVVAYLTSQYHLDPARLQAVGMGQEYPEVQTPAQTDEPRNRVVKVIKLGT